MVLFLLSKENVSMARAEAEAIFGKGTLDENVLSINTSKNSDRLSYTRMILDAIFDCKSNEVEQKIKKTNWNKLIKGSFSLTYHKFDKEISHSLSRKYGGMIYDLLKNPKVNLEKPKTKLIAIERNNKVYFGILKWENKEEFYARRPDKRPEQMPITVLPKFARACVNLTGSKKKVYDPFCGVGGFLIEAGLMKLKAVGSDIDENMLRMSKKNLEYYKIKNFKLFKQDALKINKMYDYIVTDPPYGKASKAIGVDLYGRFLIKLKKILGKRAVVVFPNFINAEKLIKKSKLKIVGKYSIYIHKSLTRNVYVLTK
ncbi:MAG: methyltransferase domain-containing protein [Nanoarchaeota archaeon]